jgi:type II secretory pathway component PulK
VTGCAPHRPADDLTISTKVKIELLADPALGALRLDVSTLNGIVTLSGTVPSQADADRAVAVAKRVSGVRDVKSALKTAGGVQRPAASVRLPVGGYQFSVTTRSRVTPSDARAVGTSVTIARGPQTKATVAG